MSFFFSFGGHQCQPALRDVMKTFAVLTPFECGVIFFYYYFLAPYFSALLSEKVWMLAKWNLELILSIVVMYNNHMSHHQLVRENWILKNSARVFSFPQFIVMSFINNHTPPPPLKYAPCFFLLFVLIYVPDATLYTCMQTFFSLQYGSHCMSFFLKKKRKRNFVCVYVSVYYVRMCVLGVGRADV